jgi:hypothetical protein
MIYVMVRNPDVNTVTLISIILAVRIIDAVVLADYDQLNPYLFYLGMVAANAIMINIVIVRPILLSRYGPKARRGHERLTMTQQDATIAWLYLAASVRLFCIISLACSISSSEPSISPQPSEFFELSLSAFDDIRTALKAEIRASSESFEGGKDMAQGRHKLLVWIVSSTFIVYLKV